MSIRSIEVAQQRALLEATIASEQSQRCCCDCVEKVACEFFSAVACSPCILSGACKVVVKEGCQALPDYFKQLFESYCTEIPSPPSQKEREAQAALDALTKKFNTMTRV